MLVVFTRYSRDRSFRVLRADRAFVLVIDTGSIVGTILGGLLLGRLSDAWLIPLLVPCSSRLRVKVWRHS